MKKTEGKTNAIKAELAKGGGFTEFLEAKKARDGRLNKLGEWLLSKGDTGMYIKDKDMKYILK